MVAWQRADDLFINLHRFSLKAFPDRTLRARLPVAARRVFGGRQHVEGFARPAGRARVKFLNIAQASLAEVGYCITPPCVRVISRRRTPTAVETDIKQVGAPLAGLIKAERTKRDIQTGAAVAYLFTVLFRPS
jgi:hypothetical protein